MLLKSFFLKNLFPRIVFVSEVFCQCHFPRALWLKVTSVGLTRFSIIVEETFFSSVQLPISFCVEIPAPVPPSILVLMADPASH